MEDRIRSAVRPRYTPGSYSMPGPYSTPTSYFTHGSSYRTSPSYMGGPPHAPGPSYVPGASYTPYAPGSSYTPGPCYAPGPSHGSGRGYPGGRVYSSGRGYGSGRGYVRGSSYTNAPSYRRGRAGYGNSIPGPYGPPHPIHGPYYGNRHGGYAYQPPSMPGHYTQPYMAAQTVHHQWYEAELDTDEEATPSSSSEERTPLHSNTRRLKASPELDTSKDQWAQPSAPQQETSAPDERPSIRSRPLKRRLSQIDPGAEMEREDKPSKARVKKEEPSQNSDVDIKKEMLYE
ncbi:hypothetical protein CBER1_07520 [Cercospora berteroae]|uniref:Uncharacterized protein n=1 Tax=Cercospora berteroae TaxID=357750 RepID=A0A2S6BUA0_9PEZI|nr:hypothetical protein CBER1_07520 [Cercospora berteroae]